jgi:hypothetical protein
MKLTAILLATALLWASHVPASGQSVSNITQTRQGLASNAAAKTVTTNYLVQTDDHTVLVDATAGAVTISLPSVSNKGYPYRVIKKIDSTANAVTVDGYGSQTIDGQTSLTLAVQYAGVVLHADGTEWRVVAWMPVIELTENTTATNAITAAESGKTFLLNSATEFVSTLPSPAAGLRYTFIVAAAPSGASYTVVTTSSANVIKGMQVCAADAAGDTGTADDTITFADGQAVAGDMVTVWSDGTSWFAVAHSRVAAGITFTQAS